MASEPVIKLSPAAELHLTAWAFATGGREFSGLGTIRKEGNTFHVEDVFLLGVGSEVFTEFSPERQRSLPREGLKLWFHRHPLGDGKPGRHNWSGTDEHTATREPLGAPPELVQWSVAIVLTPGGWVGRVDIHTGARKGTWHCAVEPRAASREVMEECRQLLTPGLNEYIRVLLQEYEAMHALRFPSMARIYSQYERDGWSQDRFDWYQDEEPEQNPSGLLSPCCTAGMEMIEQGETCGVECAAFTCLNCGEIFVQIQSEYPELSRTAPPLPGPRPAKSKVKSRRDWRASFDTFLRRSRK